MARSLRGRDIDVTVVTTNDDGPGSVMKEVRLGARSEHESYAAWYFPKQTEFYKCSLPMRSWLKAHVADFDVVHIHAVFSFSSLVAGRIAAARKVPFIVRPLGVLNRWGMENRRRWVKAMSFRFLDLPMIKKAAAMHYTSKLELDEASRFNLTNLQRVIPMGIDLQPFENLPPRQLFADTFPETAGTRNLLFLSRIDTKKGIDLLILAFAEISPLHPNVRLIICGGGDPELITTLKSLAESKKLSDKITWAGTVSGDLRLSALAAAEIFVLPSHSENFGIALLEAMAAGLPCLSTPEVALAVDAAAHRAVRLADRTPDAIAAALDELLNSSDQRQALSRSAQSLARQNYSLPAMGDALENLYREVNRREA